MIEWVASTTGVRGFGREGTVEVEAEDWRSSGSTGALPAPVDVTVSSSVNRLTIPATAHLECPETGRSLSRGGRLPAGEYLARLDDAVGTVLRFTGPAHLDTDGDRLVLAFEGHGAVTVGFHEQGHRPPTVRVPRSNAGVAAAATAAARVAGPTGPERSHPATRSHPPLVTFGETHVPESVPTEPATDLRFSVPRDYASLFAAAPLAYYLGAELTVGGSRPALSAPSAGLERWFPCGEAFATSAARLLRRVLLLDCYARDHPGDGAWPHHRRSRLTSTPTQPTRWPPGSPPRSTPPKWTSSCRRGTSPRTSSRVSSTPGRCHTCSAG